MSRSFFNAVCFLALLHSTLALPIILPRDGVTEEKPQAVRQKCLLLCGGYYDWDDDYWYDDWSWDDYDDRPVHDWLDDVPDPAPAPAPTPDPPKHKHHDPPSSPPPDEWDEYYDWPDCGICISLKGTEGPDGGPAGTPKHSTAKSVTQEPSVANGGSGSKLSAVAQSGNEKSPVSESGNTESSVPQSASKESSVPQNATQESSVPQSATQESSVVKIS
ncbi:hypothetical protein PCANC_03624 [Puccinia coronata f. sp. avenae]|uniref:Uncharacterized protein n=1 Tax=Puccinia coronata f. sp. avenae TaxID=200324 RepID=A0A2N5UEK6_9BASI|nr:hypothetical protein PCASD_10453 [Puccinia coronata f. sp. avenae]PLW53772.1 hypothetical protein PCANC_03624 [Puccinia coronata f. sp. avenae]